MRNVSKKPPVARLVWALAALVGAGLVLPLVAQVPADAVFSDFEKTGDYVFELGGKVLEHAEIYHSERAVAYLILAPELASPLLVNPRTRQVESVHLMKVAKREDGTIDLLADAALDTVGPFTIEGTELAFEVRGQKARFKPRPPLLGLRTGEDLKDYSPEYGRDALAYNPQAIVLQQLKKESRDVKVRVYFGSWCPACKRMVPRMLGVADAIDGSQIDFEYYGLPQSLSDDPETDRMNIRSVPTAVIFVGSKEVGRLTNEQWNAPEAGLLRILGSAS